MQRIEDRGVRRSSTVFETKRIAVAVSGGIGSVEVVKIIREIRRRSGDVTVFMTNDALKFITPISLEWASNHPVIQDDDAKVQHLDLFDMVVVVPATLNTISKASVGIADNPVTLLVAAQLGRRGRLLFVPTMNQVLMEHPSFKESEAKLKGWGANFFRTEIEEDRLKMPDAVLLVDHLERNMKDKSE